MQLVTDPAYRAAAAKRLIDDVALVISHVVADARGVYLMNAGPGRTQPAPFVKALRASGLEGIVNGTEQDIAEWDLPSLQRQVQNVLFQLQWDERPRRNRRLTNDERQVRAAARRIYDAIDLTCAVLLATNKEEQ
jgi:hypothetical protein